ncbi:hypothetical protein J6590_065098 [Homalodisca vitripennis]|nr:hypothetical protein J6590_065098 [Homalodisca vitripennis]
MCGEFSFSRVSRYNISRGYDALRNLQEEWSAVVRAQVNDAAGATCDLILLPSCASKPM